MNSKLLIICGPTATGKTSLGVQLAKKFNGEIISADSRQVYRGMDIGTGKDLNKDAKYEVIDNNLGFYEINGVRIFGYDLVDPKEEFSISKYLKFAEKTLRDIKSRNKLPIVVGGTGFYIRGIVDGIPTINVPRNDSLRGQLEQKSVDELFESLSQLDSLKAASLNSSDKKNPRRLIRAVEVAQYVLDHKLNIPEIEMGTGGDTLFIGLTAQKDYLDYRIETRVDDRVSAGMREEVKKLLGDGVTWHDQSMYSLGYRQYRDFFEGGVEEEQIISEWKREERNYAGRQLVWFKKDKRINWFDIRDSNYKKNVENMIEVWHNQTNGPQG